MSNRGPFAFLSSFLNMPFMPFSSRLGDKLGSASVFSVEFYPSRCSSWVTVIVTFTSIVDYALRECLA